MPDFIVNGPSSAATTLLLAHGSGTPMDHPWMAAMAEAIASRGVRVVRFEFAYMAARRDGKSRPPPAPANRLIGEWIEVIGAVGAEAKGKLIIGGKSLGGRMASMIADKEFKAGRVAGLVCLGYPFHPPGQPEKLRTDHLEQLACPTHIFQGERDPFGTRDEVSGYPLSRAITLHWMADGDHDLKPRKASGKTLADHVDAVAAVIAGL